MSQPNELEILSADVIARTEVAISLSNGATIVLSADQLVEYTPVEPDGTEGEAPMGV